MTDDQIIDIFRAHDDGCDAGALAVGRAIEKAAEAAAIERCAKFMESRANEIAAADSCTANMMAAIYRDEANSLRALLPKEES